jgi:leader peptidase (prepilin peptidase)/N-methyltransferase
MIILIILIGLLVGWMVNWAVDYLPRYAASRPTTVTMRLYPPALRAGVELVSALAIAYLWTQLGLSWNLLFYAGAYAFFLLIAMIDLKYRLVLNVMTYPAIAALLLVHCVFLRQNTLHVLLGGSLAFAIFFLTAWLKPDDLGSGDVKLATLIGVAFGFPQVLWALIVGGSSGALVAVILLLRRREAKMTMPYAPFLCLGAMVAILYNPILLPV